MIESEVYRSSNPFRSSNIRPGANSFVFNSHVVVDDLFRELCRNRQGQIVGPHGSGKSTLMLNVVRCASAAGFRVAQYILDARHRVRQGPTDQMLLGVDRALAEIDLLAIDGFEQLSRRERSLTVKKCRSRGKHLLITSHRDLGLADIYRTKVDLKIARCVVAEICDRELVPPPSDAQLEQLLRQHRGNLRETLFALYDEYRSLELRP